LQVLQVLLLALQELLLLQELLYCGYRRYLWLSVFFNFVLRLI
jgi:hypothetical protein